MMKKVICIAKNEEDCAERDLLEVGETYEVEEEKNYTPPIEDYPNPFYLLKGINDECTCCGERVSFWSGLFQEYSSKTKKV